MSCCISVRGDLNEGLAAIDLERKAAIQLVRWVCFLTISLMLLLPGGSLRRKHAEPFRAEYRTQVAPWLGAVITRDQS